MTEDTLSKQWDMSQSDFELCCVFFFLLCFEEGSRQNVSEAKLCYSSVPSTVAHTWNPGTWASSGPIALRSEFKACLGDKVKTRINK